MKDGKKFAKKVPAITRELYRFRLVPVERDELHVWACRAHANRVGRQPLGLLVWLLAQPEEKRTEWLTEADHEQGSRDRKATFSRRARYREFLRSGKWWAVRTRTLRKAGYKCAACGRRRPKRELDVHHKNYNRPWGEEDENDLEVLCRDCHAAKHGRVAHPVRGWNTVEESIESSGLFDFGGKRRKPKNG